ncbi:MAG: hypothetical protein BWY00_01788 [Firmicutes bacterium ADurb.Bin153]|nr:MAG: hypothetical protein BWY00_01788 [Firmicutes bacterium ADurb.Bin153]
MKPKAACLAAEERNMTAFSWLLSSFRVKYQCPEPYLLRSATSPMTDMPVKSGSSSNMRAILALMSLTVTIPARSPLSSDSRPA